MGFSKTSYIIDLISNIKSLFKPKQRFSDKKKRFVCCITNLAPFILYLEIFKFPKVALKGFIRSLFEPFPNCDKHIKKYFPKIIQLVFGKYAYELLILKPCKILI